MQKIRATVNSPGRASHACRGRGSPRVATGTRASIRPTVACTGTAEDEGQRRVDDDEVERRPSSVVTSPRSKSSRRDAAQQFDVGDPDLATVCSATATSLPAATRCARADAPQRQPARATSSHEGERRGREAARPACALLPPRRAPAAAARPSCGGHALDRFARQVVDVGRRQRQDTPRAPTVISVPPRTAAMSTGPAMPLGDQIVERPFGADRAFHRGSPEDARLAGRRSAG